MHRRADLRYFLLLVHKLKFCRDFFKVFLLLLFDISTRCKKTSDEMSILSSNRREGAKCLAAAVET